MNPTKRGSLGEIAAVFFKLGCIAFGGPAAHIAMMEQEIVEKRKWMDRQHFLDLIGVTNLIPGPNSTEMTMHCGYERGGILGLFIAGTAFIFPAVVITGFLAWLYVSYGHLPDAQPFVYGIKPAVLAIIAGAIFKLGKKAVKSLELAVFGIIVFGLSLYGFNEIFCLLEAGIAGGMYFYIKNRSVGEQGEVKSILPLLTVSGTSAAVTKITTLKIFWTFLKVGSVLYGSGYVLFAYLDAELVETGWMMRQELIDAIAVGQFTPGPVLSTATFVGWQLGGIWGALAATIGIFLPSFIFVLLLNPLLKKIRKSAILKGFLDTVNVSAVAIMVTVLIVMTIEVIFPSTPELTMDWKAMVIAAISAVVTFGTKVNAMWIVLGSAVLGYVLMLI